jgi:hypothetical protein
MRGVFNARVLVTAKTGLPKTLHFGATRNLKQTVFSPAKLQRVHTHITTSITSSVVSPDKHSMFRYQTPIVIPEGPTADKQITATVIMLHGLGDTGVQQHTWGCDLLSAQPYAAGLLNKRSWTFDKLHVCYRAVLCVGALQVKVGPILQSSLPQCSLTFGTFVLQPCCTPPVQLHPVEGCLSWERT